MISKSRLWSMVYSIKRTIEVCLVTLYEPHGNNLFVSTFGFEEHSNSFL